MSVLNELCCRATRLRLQYHDAGQPG